MAYIPSTSHVTLLATLRRQRLLPLAGEVIVEQRQRVEATAVVARTYVAERHRLVDLARDLRLPAEKADAALLKKDGDMVRAGEPLATRKVLLGLFTRAARSPVDGRLVAAAGGKALIAAISKPYELRAGIPGTVVTVVPSKAVVIETTGALLEGVWGNGREDTAALRLVSEDPALALKPGGIDVGMRGAILAVGVLANPAVLKPLIDLGVRGLVVGTLGPGLLPQVLKLEIPVLIVEGFGSAGFSAPAQALLAANAGREAWLHAVPLDRFRGQRPELIVPLPGPSASPPPVLEGEALAVGKRVRLLRGPGAGRVGTITALNERLVTLPSGLRTRTATVAFQGAPDAPERVAYANLELVE